MATATIPLKGSASMESKKVSISDYYPAEIFYASGF